MAFSRAARRFSRSLPAAACLMTGLVNPADHHMPDASSATVISSMGRLDFVASSRAATTTVRLVCTRGAGCAGAGRRRDRMRLLFVAMSAIPDWNLTDLMTVVKSGPVAKNRLVPFRPDRRPNPGRRSSYSVEGSQFIASSNAFARSRCMVTGAISSRARLASPGASLLSANPFRRVRVSLCAATCCSR